MNEFWSEFSRINRGKVPCKIGFSGFTPTIFSLTTYVSRTRVSPVGISLLIEEKIASQEEKNHKIYNKMHTTKLQMKFLPQTKYFIAQ